MNRSEIGIKVLRNYGIFTFSHNQLYRGINSQHQFHAEPGSEKCQGQPRTRSLRCPVMLLSIE